MDPASLRLSGAVPLDSLAATRAAGSASSAASSSVNVIDVSEASFQDDVLQRSMSVPVVVDFWAAWCGPCKQLSPILEKLAAEGGGSWVLAKIDVDANPRIAQAAQVQGIPAVKALVNGQVVGEFTGALPESKVRQWIGQLVDAAAKGTFGALTGASAEDASAEPAIDPDLLEADDALVAGDLDASEAAYRRLYERPGVSAELRAEARGGIARVELLRRVESVDQEALQAAVMADPTDVPNALKFADLLVLNEQAEDALDRLLQLVRSTSGDDRDAVRKHLLTLFEVLGDDDPLVGTTRRKLASALF